MSGQIKCVVWDLDQTLWQGVLTEGGGQVLCSGIAEIIPELDRRGIIQSIASKNDMTVAMKRLEEFGLSQYFLCPQISWGPKSSGIQTILSTLNLKPEAVAFVDDSAFERDEVQHTHPRIRVYDAKEATELPNKQEFTVRFITEDSANRRKMYQADIARQSAEDTFEGTSEEFLAGLGMHLDISPVTEQYLRRVEELTIRTHQLNSTGYTYSFEELAAMAQSPDYIFLICGLKDRYGDSGKVGLLLLEKQAGNILRLKLLIVSCRVMSRGIGSALLAYATQIADSLCCKLQAEYLETEYNRIMYITYRLSGFDEISDNGNQILLEYADHVPIPLPEYLQCNLPDGFSTIG